MRSIVLALMVFGLSFAAKAELVEPQAALATTTIHTLDNGHQIVSEISRGNKDTFVLLNGLVYATSRWNGVANRLAEAGHTVVRMAYVAQPESLRLLKNGQTPEFFRGGLTSKTLAEDVYSTLLQLGIETPIQLVGLSYGSSVATEFALRYPNQVDQLILASPLVVSVDEYNPGGAAIRQWLARVRKTENAACDLYGAINPYLCAFRDALYDTYYTSIYEPYLNQRIKDIPAGVSESVYKKAMFYLVRAARDFDLRAISPKLKNVHLLVASEDDPPLRADQNLSWDRMNKQERRSQVIFKGAHHALPDEAPSQMAAVLEAIADRDPAYQSGETLEIELGN